MDESVQGGQWQHSFDLQHFHLSTFHPDGGIDQAAVASLTGSGQNYKEGSVVASYTASVSANQ